MNILMSLYHWLLSPPIQAGLHSLPERAYGVFAEATLTSLIFLAIVFHAAGRSIATQLSTSGRYSAWARVLATVGVGCFSLIGCVTREWPHGDMEGYLSLGFRAWLVFIIIEGLFAVILPIVGRLASTIAAPVRWLRKRLPGISTRLPRLSLRRRAIQPPALPSEPPTFKTRVEQAKREYEDACQTLRSAGLDDDELDSATLEARQKYVRQLQGILADEVR